MQDMPETGQYVNLHAGIRGDELFICTSSSLKQFAQCNRKSLSNLGQYKEQPQEACRQPQNSRFEKYQIETTRNIC